MTKLLSIRLPKTLGFTKSMTLINVVKDTWLEHNGHLRQVIGLQTGMLDPNCLSHKD